jgi:hypothetical protein
VHRFCDIVCLRACAQFTVKLLVNTMAAHARKLVLPMAAASARAAAPASLVAAPHVVGCRLALLCGGSSATMHYQSTVDEIYGGDG